MVRKPLIVLTGVLLQIISGALHAEIYKWVDENGQITYSDIPQAESSAPAGIQKTESDSPPENATEGSDNYQKRVLDSLTQERRQREQEKAEQDKKQSERKRQCEQAQKRLNEAENARYLYTEDEQGEKVIFSDEQRQVAIDQARAAVKQYCK
jgi:hypothetical protein